MAIQQVRVDREMIRQVLADSLHVQRLKSNHLDRSYYTDDAANQRYVRPGLIVAQETTTKKYVPYNASALYGTGSDTAVGVMVEFQDATNEDPAVDPVFHAKIIEAHCYVWGGALGTVPAGVKTALNMIEWV